MRSEKCVPGMMLMFLGLAMILAGSASAQTPQKSIHSPDGWTVRYGVVDGATTQPAAMVSVLRSVAKSSGESPLIGQPFRYKGTNTVGVFYVVRDHSAQNVPMIGLILSDFDDKKQVEAALMYDTAARFPSTLKPMMMTVFKEWRPGGAKPAAIAPVKVAPSGKVPPLHSVALSDGTASVNIPDGWQVAQQSHLGTIAILGPHHEFIVLNGNMLAQDPRSYGYQSAARMGIRPHLLVFPYDTDWVRAFPTLYLAFAQVLKMNSTGLTIDHAELLPATTGNRRYVQGIGHVDNNDGVGSMELNAMFCPEPPEQPQTGIYMIFEFISLVPKAYADQERATTAAILSSYQWDEVRAKSIAAAQAAPQIAAMSGVYREHMRALTQFTQSQIDRTREIGRQATERYVQADRQRIDSARGFDKQEENVSRYVQGFSNYILDQNVIQYTNPSGDFVHKTVPNDIAYNLVKLHPDKVEIVSTPNYIPVVDFIK